MLQIKSFKDGDRFVVVFEGMDNIPSTENVITAFLTGITNVPVKKDAEAKVEPVHTDENPSDIMVNETFSSGPYAGKTPAEILSVNDIQMQNKAFAYICEELKRNGSTFSETMKKSVYDYLKRRYETCNPEEYSKKLSDGQVRYFYTFHEPVINDSMKRKICEKFEKKCWTAFLFSEDKILREGVAEIIKQFQ